MMRFLIWSKTSMKFQRSQNPLHQQLMNQMQPRPRKLKNRVYLVGYVGHSNNKGSQILNDCAPVLEAAVSKASKLLEAKCLLVPVSQLRSFSTGIINFSFKIKIVR